jgi:hypothetical protein
MSEMFRLLLMGLGCSALLGLGSCMLFTGSLVYVGSRSAADLREAAEEQREKKADPWESGASSYSSGKEVPRSYDGGNHISTAGRYGEPNMVMPPAHRGE